MWEERTKPKNIINVSCVFFKLLYCQIGINIILVVYSLLLYEIIIIYLDNTINILKL